MLTELDRDFESENYEAKKTGEPPAFILDSMKKVSECEGANLWKKAFEAYSELESELDGLRIDDEPYVIPDFEHEQLKLAFFDKSINGLLVLRETN